MSVALEGLDAFTAKWRRHWPEWEVVKVFVPGSQREDAVAWFALLQELADAAWGGEDPTPGLAKLAWWQEELRGWGKGARRHPLGAALRGEPVDWDAFATSLSVLRHRDVVTGDVAHLLSTLAPVADAAVQAEAALFGGDEGAGEGVSAALVAPWVAGDPARARRVLDHWRVAGPRPRRVYAAMARSRLERAARGRVDPSSRWRVLWQAWRAARN